MRKLTLATFVSAGTLIVAISILSMEVKANTFSVCNPCDPVFRKGSSQCRGSQWEFGGWIETGVYVNQYGQRNAYTDGEFDEWSGNTWLVDNVRQSDLQVNQLWLYLGRTLNTRRGFDIGGRVDLNFGTSSNFLQSDGLEFRSRSSGMQGGWGKGDYRLAFAQLYGEVGYRNVSAKFGKFMGYCVMAPTHFFYSHGYLCDNLLVGTYTGVVFTWNANEKLSLSGGWVNGQDIDGHDLSFGNSNSNAFLFVVEYAFSEKFSMEYTGLVGREKHPRGVPTNLYEYFGQSLSFNIKPNNRWEYMFGWAFRNDNDVEDRWGAYGIVNELIYHFNKRCAIGTRIEWKHMYSSDLGGIIGANGADLFGITVGLNWRPNDRLVIRPEVRYDRVFSGGFLDDSGNSAGLFNRTRGNGRNDQFSGGASIVVKF